MTSRHKGKSKGEAKEKRTVVAECTEGRQGQRALKEMKLNPTAPLTGGTRRVILKQVFHLFFLTKGYPRDCCQQQGSNIHLVFDRSWPNFFSARLCIFNVAQTVKGHNNQTALFPRKHSYWQKDYWQHKEEFVVVFFCGAFKTATGF